MINRAFKKNHSKLYRISINQGLKYNAQKKK